MINVRLFDDDLKQAILDLPYNDKIDSNGEHCCMILIQEGDYGYAEIYRMYDDILVFMIPMYGGTPSLTYHVGIHSVDYLVEKLKTL